MLISSAGRQIILLWDRASVALYPISLSLLLSQILANAEMRKCIIKEAELP